MLTAGNKEYTLERNGYVISANAKGFNSLVKLFNQDFIDELVAIGWLVKKECEICGKTFYRTTPTAKRQFCSEECKEVHLKKYRATRGKELRQKRESNKKNKTKHLDDEIDKAREMGLSYGQYKAKKYIEEMEKIKIE